MFWIFHDNFCNGMLQDDQTALYLAACNGNVATVKLLLKKGADVNICDKVLKMLRFVI